MIFGLDAFAPYVAALMLIALLAAFAMEWRPPEVCALVAVAVFLVLGLISSRDLVGVFANPAPVTIGAMSIMSAALARTGALDSLAKLMIAGVAKRPEITVFLFLLFQTAISGFMNNTPQVVMMIPVTLALAKALNESGSRLLIPLSYAAILGGTISIIGASTNILVDGVAQTAGLKPFGVFEIAPLGLINAAIGIVFIFLFRKALPERPSMSSLLDRNETPRYIVEVAIEDDSPYIGQRALDVKNFNDGDTRLVDVVRGDASLRREMGRVVFAPGDIVVMRSPVKDILGFKQAPDIKSPTGGLQPLSTRSSVLVEILLAPGANFVGKTLRHLRLRRRYGVYPVALHRRSANIAERFEYTPLEVGDTLLIEGAPEDLSRLCDDNDLVNVVTPRERAVKKTHAPIAIATLLGVVGLASIGVMPIAGIATIGAAVVLATKCIEADEAFAAIDWRILSLIIAMLAVGKGIENTHLAELIVGGTRPMLEAVPARTALALTYLLAMTLTEVVTANAVAVIITPIAIGIASSLGIDPRPFVVAVMFAASSSFMTPIGYQTNTLVYNLGGYRFTDYLRLGTPLNLICAVVAIIFIPVFWPF